MNAEENLGCEQSAHALYFISYSKFVTVESPLCLPRIHGQLLEADSMQTVKNMRYWNELLNKMYLFRICLPLMNKKYYLQGGAEG